MLKIIFDSVLIKVYEAVNGCHPLSKKLLWMINIFKVSLLHPKIIAVTHENLSMASSCGVVSQTGLYCDSDRSSISVF